MKNLASGAVTAPFDIPDVQVGQVRAAFRDYTQHFALRLES